MHTSAFVALPRAHKVFVRAKEAAGKQHEEDEHCVLQDSHVQGHCEWVLEVFHQLRDGGAKDARRIEAHPLIRLAIAVDFVSTRRIERPFDAPTGQCPQRARLDHLDGRHVLHLEHSRLSWHTLREVRDLQERRKARARLLELVTGHL